MKQSNVYSWWPLLVLCLVALLAACGGTPAPEAGTTSQSPTAEPAEATSTTTAAATATVPAAETATMTPTPTPTAEPVVLPATPSPAAASRCQGLGGTLEVQVLVGPAEAVGLEPVAVGDVPFAVTTQQAPYGVEGQAPITYEAVLAEAWGTYTVNMDLEMAVSGECTGEDGNELLDLVLDMSGEQLVEVEAEGFHGEYPWSGSHALDLSFPLQEGATAEGEGWVVVLHLGSGQ
ncbi:MAG: hypothetical protein P8189_31615 [Anaerolineae bacterium]